MSFSTAQMRRTFLSETLPAAIGVDPSPFYEAFEESEDAMASYFTSLWEAQLAEAGEALGDHPFFPLIDPYVLEDTPEGFCAIVTVTLPKIANAADVIGAIVFGSAMDPRVFAALPVSLAKGETLGVAECRDGGLREVGVLYQGCDNGMQLFDAPNPQKCDKQMPLMPARRAAAFIDAVICYCMEHD